ncbi:hypothetical protein BE221DRAFT_203857 [Ostreococcus tauri]|uniref:Uncharacterized protein n=1 Tax=Ostreococcus tauri TaxID=70448 RepID=A0A1Y5IHU6_OSTTA|nr:hypothetical protein BE221DRAFT_203857 [Ostreococcus tauri]
MNIPAVDAIRLFEANPRALMLNDLNACAKALNELSKEFPSVDFIALMSSFTGAELAAMVSVGFILGTHATFSAALEAKLILMSAELRRVCGYEHWIKGAFLITNVEAANDENREIVDSKWGRLRRRIPEREDDAGEDIITGVNLSGLQSLDEVVAGESRLFEVVDGEEGFRTMVR